MQDIDAQGDLRNATMADTAHRMNAGPFDQGLEVSLLELPGAGTELRFGLQLKDKAPVADPAAPGVSGLWKYELIYQHLDKAGDVKNALSIKGAHRMSIATANTEFDVVLAELPAAGGFASRFHLTLKEK